MTDFPCPTCRHYREVDMVFEVKPLCGHPVHGRYDRESKKYRNAYDTLLMACRNGKLWEARWYMKDKHR